MMSLKPDEIDLDVVVDRDAERLRHGRGQTFRTLVVGTVDPLALARSGDLDPEVARQADQRCAAVAFLAQHHDRVAAATGDVAGRADHGVVGGVGVDALAGVRSDEQVVLGRVLDRRVVLVGDVGEHAVEAADPFDVVGA